MYSKRALTQRTNQAKARIAIAAQAASLSDGEQAAELRRIIQNHLSSQEHALTTARLIDLIIERWPDCPKFASLLVDRLLHGDEALAAALQEG